MAERRSTEKSSKIAPGVPREPPKHAKELQNGAQSSPRDPQETKSEKCARLVRERFSDVKMPINIKEVAGPKVTI